LSIDEDADAATMIIMIARYLKAKMKIGETRTRIQIFRAQDSELRTETGAVVAKSPGQ